MSAKFEKNFAMSDVAYMARLPVRAARALIEREERKSGSRMVAYETVASAVGASADWLRDFVGPNPRVSLSFQTGWNILSVYRQWCSRVEQEIANERALIAALKAEIDAATESTLAMVDGAAGTQAPGATQGEG